MLQKYKLYFNCAIVYCTKWKIFSLPTARNGKFLAFQLHEMESFLPLHCTKWKIKREENSMFCILETKIQATKVERLSSLNHKVISFGDLRRNCLVIYRNKPGKCEIFAAIKADYVKINEKSTRIM